MTIKKIGTKLFYVHNLHEGPKITPVFINSISRCKTIKKQSIINSIEYVLLTGDGKYFSSENKSTIKKEYFSTIKEATKHRNILLEKNLQEKYDERLYHINIFYNENKNDLEKFGYKMIKISKNL